MKFMTYRKLADKHAHHNLFLFHIPYSYSEYGTAIHMKLKYMENEEGYIILLNSC